MSRKAKPKDKRSYIFSGMENRRQASTSSASSLDHLFGPKDPSSSSQSGIFGTIFPPPSVVKVVLLGFLFINMYSHMISFVDFDDWKPRIGYEDQSCFLFQLHPIGFDR